MDERTQLTILIEALAAPDPVQLALRAIKVEWTAEQTNGRRRARSVTASPAPGAAASGPDFAVREAAEGPVFW